MHKTVFDLTPLEIFFISTTIISLVLNIIQWRERKSLSDPLANILRSLFNDIKSKENRTFFTYNALFSPNNPHESIETLRWEYGLFAQSVMSFLQGFKEILVGALVTLKPKDIDGKFVFRASEYGLTEEEKELRKKYLESKQDQRINTDSVNLESANSSE